MAEIHVADHAANTKRGRRIGGRDQRRAHGELPQEVLGDQEAGVAEVGDLSSLGAPVRPSRRRAVDDAEPELRRAQDPAAPFFSRKPLALSWSRILLV